MDSRGLEYPQPQRTDMDDASNLSSSMRIQKAQTIRDARPRTDPRFLQGRRILDSMGELYSSIGVTLFSSGYVRHDKLLRHGFQTADPIWESVISMPRFPYDRASRNFLNALELGVLPLKEDLPVEEARVYYGGWLVAEIYDFRGIQDDFLSVNWKTLRNINAFSRVLLRPDACNHIEDTVDLVAGMEDDDALSLEGQLLLSLNKDLELDPRPVLKAPYYPVPRRKRRQDRRNLKDHNTNFSNSAENARFSALMLISASEKMQVQSLLTSNASRVAIRRRPRSTLMPTDMTLPPRKILCIPNLSGSGFRCLSKTMPRTRVIRLIRPDFHTAVEMAKYGDGEYTVDIVIAKVHHSFQTEGRCVGLYESFLSLEQKSGQGYSVAFKHAVFGYNDIESGKTPTQSLLNAQIFMDSMKKLKEKEGYLCIHDGNPLLAARAPSSEELSRTLFCALI